MGTYTAAGFYLHAAAADHALHQSDILDGCATSTEASAGLDEGSLRFAGQDAGGDFLFVGELARLKNDLEWVWLAGLDGHDQVLEDCLQVAGLERGNFFGA